MFCPKCKSEYRPGIETCAHCAVPLVHEPPASELIKDDDETVAVGTSGEHVSLQTLEVEGRQVDLQKAFTFDVASELVRDLDQAAIPSVLRPLSVVRQRDPRPLFEVHVRPQHEQEAAKILHRRWARMADDEAGGAIDATDIEHCPACGASVPLDASECPDCGLGIGSAVEDEEEDAEA